jgi:hypothetical protein
MSAGATGARVSASRSAQLGQAETQRVEVARGVLARSRHQFELDRANRCFQRSATKLGECRRGTVANPHQVCARVPRGSRRLGVRDSGLAECVPSPAQLRESDIDNRGCRSALFLGGSFGGGEVCKDLSTLFSSLGLDLRKCGACGG